MSESDESSGRSRRAIPGLILAALVVAGTCVATAGSVRVGRVREVQGPAERSRTEAWESAAANDELLDGDRLRTGTGGMLRLELEPDSWITLGTNTEIVIARHKFDPGGWHDTLVTLVDGSIRGSANVAYEASDSEFRITTPTAHVRVFGGEFTVVYSSKLAVTDVFGGHGRMSLRSASSPTATEVSVGAHQAARVKDGQEPEPPYRTDWVLSDLVAGSNSATSALDLTLWPNSAALAADSLNLPPGPTIRSDGNALGSSVSASNDVGAVVGQPPAALTGTGGLLTFGN